MRTIAALGILTLGAALGAADKLTWQDRVELDRGLVFEYANVKVLLPRSRTRPPGRLSPSRLAPPRARETWCRSPR
jgi:hypothetical protein